MAGRTQQENDNATLLSATLRTLVGLIGERSDLSVENPMAGVLSKYLCASAIAAMRKRNIHGMRAKARTATRQSEIGKDLDDDRRT
jgi:hypothetical protein